MLHGVDAAHEVVVFGLGPTPNLVRDCEPYPLGLVDQGRQVQGDHGEQDSAAGAALLVPRDLLGDAQPAEEGPGRGQAFGAADLQDLGGLLHPHPGVVTHAALLDRDHAAVHVQVLDHEALPAVQVDRAGVGLLEGPVGVDEADDGSLGGGLDGHGLAGSAQVHLAVGLFAAGEGFAAVGGLQQLAAGQEPLQAGREAGIAQQLLVAGQGQLGSGADQVAVHDDLVVGIDHGGLGRPAEEVLGVAHEVLVQGVLAGDHDHGRLPLAAAHPSAALQGLHDRARVAHQDAQVEPADVDAELQGAGGDDRQQVARGHAGFDVPPLLREEPGPVGADPALEIAG